MKALVEKWAFDTSIRPPLYAQQSFLSADGFLFHVIDGKVRAQVPGAYVPEYLTSENVSQSLTEKEQFSIVCEFPDQIPNEISKAILAEDKTESPSTPNIETIIEG